MHIKKCDHLLEYRVLDVLEMNYSQNQKMVETVKTHLLRKPIRDKRLHPFFTFLLGDVLVVIDSGVSRIFRKLFLLNSHKQSFRVLELAGSNFRLVKENCCDGNLFRERNGNHAAFHAQKNTQVRSSA